jgi:hypothetical protein
MSQTKICPKAMKQTFSANILIEGISKYIMQLIANVNVSVLDVARLGCILVLFFDFIDRIFLLFGISRVHASRLFEFELVPSIESI